MRTAAAVLLPAVAEAIIGVGVARTEFRGSRDSIELVVAIAPIPVHAVCGAGDIHVGKPGKPGGNLGTDGTFSGFSDMLFRPWLVWPV